jgi:pimeloyl-ACP methyl ester carboxylesterase
MVRDGRKSLTLSLGPCPYMHSQGGNFGFTAALNAPDKIKALVAVEPSGVAHAVLGGLHHRYARI